MTFLDHLPHPGERNIALHVTPAAERALKNGHPWLFENGIQKQSHAGSPGDLAVIFDRKRRFLAIGLYDPESPIRVKILQHQQSATINQDFYHDKLQAAATLREPLQAQDTNGYRLVHGENDGLPGLVVDRYAETLVIKLYSAAWLPHLHEMLPALEAVQPAENWGLRLSRTMQDGETFGLRDGQILRGNLPDTEIIFSENGLTFSADVVHGHKTGFFFDQRENRARVREHAAGKTVLDVFSYNGGFSVYAAAGGAKHVLSLDVSQPALESAQANMRLNLDNKNVAACEHRVLAADAFDALDEMQERFELVIVDPPSFAKSQAEVDGALAAYAKLTHLALKRLKPGGILVSASCSSRVSAEDFFDTVNQAARREGRPLQEIERTRHALDHPMIEAFPEGSYLKCLYAQA